MKKIYPSLLSLLFILGILGFFFLTLMPHWTSNKEVALSEFSTQRALQQVRNISKEPHYVGTENHNVVAHYLVTELRKMGLETSFQEGFTFTEKGTLTKSKNVLARINGSDSKKALLLLSHYDSAPHSYSLGASDAGSGVATILESVRAFVYNKKQHKNDIIILFSDAEELGMNGAALFVTQHKWAKEVGLVLNFEARGSSGPSYMFMETNGGNAGLTKEFAAANTQYPVSNSVFYSIYKLMPNFTDLTVFREQANIPGYNFAFIDDHYNYHTAQDNINNLDKNTLTHQGTYLMPLLNYFSNANLNSLETNEDEVYFSIPFAFINYSFDWVLPMALLALFFLGFLIFIGIAKRILSIKEMVKGCIPLFGSLITSGAISFFGWKILLIVYPQYNDLLNGFTYNGHDYMVAFTLLSLGICFVFYEIFTVKRRAMNHFVPPLLLWIIINLGIAFFLKGAGYFVIPVYAGLIMLAAYVMTQQSKWILNLFFSIPALFLIAPFVQMLPIGLGLKTLFITSILTVLLFGLLLPVFSSFTRKGGSSLIFFILAIGFFVKADYNSNYEKGKAKSNSLVYFLDADKNKSYWTTYTTNLDDWTKQYLGSNPKNADELNTLSLPSKYNSGFSFMANAPLKELAKPSIEFLTDSIVGINRYLKIRITPNRKVNRYDIFANQNLTIQNFKANGTTLLGQKGSKYERKGKELLSYYVVDQIPLEIEFNIATASVLDLNLIESSFDLMNNPLFQMAKRADWMMPTQFVLTDAILIQQKIIPSSRVVIPVNRIELKKMITKPIVIDTISVIK